MIHFMTSRGVNSYQQRYDRKTKDFNDIAVQC